MSEATCQTKQSVLNKEQIFHAIHAVEEWLRIKEDEGLSTNSPDPSHSSLLYWLLQGNDPLDKPPPTILSRPHHNLAIGEPVVLPDPPISLPEGTIIAGSLTWKWSDPSKGILMHMPSETFYHWDSETNTLQLLSARREQE